MPTPQSPNTKPVNNTGNAYVHPDHGVIAAAAQGVADFVNKGGLLGKPAPKPSTAPTGPVKAAAKPTGKITITAGKTTPAQTPRYASTETGQGNFIKRG